MRQRGIDLGFLRPEPLSPVVEGWTPEAVVTFGKAADLPAFDGARTESWDLSSPPPEDDAAWTALAEEIEGRVKQLTDRL
jgi:hypothetical protein